MRRVDFGILRKGEKYHLRGGGGFSKSYVQKQITREGIYNIHNNNIHNIQPLNLSTNIFTLCARRKTLLSL
jgi:hypothetical protein